jgi:putative transposase
MPSKYAISDHQKPHFVSFATVQWVDALSRPDYKNVIIESLKYCQIKKGLILHAFVIMNNHIHLIASAKEGFNLSDILRDFKKHTSKTLLREILHNEKESRRSWMKWIFESAGKQNSNNKNFQFWRQDNRPIELSTNEMMDQRLDYLHDNPVVEGIVYEPEQYVYSSAVNYAGGDGLLEVEFLD